MKTEYAMGREYQVEEPGDHPAAKDHYMMVFWEEEEKLNGVLALVDLLHEKDREIEAWKRVCEKAVADYEKRNLDYWELKNLRIREDNL